MHILSYWICDIKRFLDLDILQIRIVVEFVSKIILYIPLIISALIVLIIGLLIVDFLTNIIHKVLIATGVDEKFLKTSVGETLKATDTTISGIISGVIKLFGYLIFLLASIDFFADYLQKMMKGMKVEGSDVIIPILRGFLFLVVLLLALDSMLIKTTVFYTFLGPLAWGFAVVVAFK